MRYLISSRDVEGNWERRYLAASNPNDILSETYLYQVFRFSMPSRKRLVDRSANLLSETGPVGLNQVYVQLMAPMRYMAAAVRSSAVSPGFTAATISLKDCTTARSRSRTRSCCVFDRQWSSLRRTICLSRECMYTARSALITFSRRSSGLDDCFAASRAVFTRSVQCDCSMSKSKDSFDS